MTRDGGRRSGPIAWLLIQPIRFYQKFITPYTPATCRYYPTCSQYAVQSLRTHGAFKGLALTAWRLLRCNPWSKGGIDPTPVRGRWRSAGTLLPDEPATEPTAGGRATEDDVIRAAAASTTSGESDTVADENPCVTPDAPNAGRAAA